jgi:hypothetical protein
MHQVAATRDRVRHHKREIVRHRESLSVAATELRLLEEQCQRLGITLVVHAAPITKA